MNIFILPEILILAVYQSVFINDIYYGKTLIIYIVANNINLDNNFTSIIDIDFIFNVHTLCIKQFQMAKGFATNDFDCNHYFKDGDSRFCFS